MPVRNRMRPIHPGEILRDQYLTPLGMSANKLATNLDVPPNRVTAILNGTRAVTAETALRLGRFFDTTPDFWLNMQKAYELRKAEVEMGEEIARTVRPKVETGQEVVRTARSKAVAVPALLLYPVPSRDGPGFGAVSHFVYR